MKVKTISETKIIKIDDAEFTIGVINRKIWVTEIKPKLSAMQIALSKISKDKKEVTTEDIVKDEYKNIESIFLSAYWELVKYGIRGHSNIIDGSGKEIEFATCAFNIVHDDIISLYDLNGLLPKLGNEIIFFNTLTDDDKKN